MPNGAYGGDSGESIQAAMSASAQQDASPERPIVQINQINLTSKQLLAGVMAVCTLIGSGAFGGWLFMPARATDLDALKGIVELVRTEQQTNKEAIQRMTQAVDNLAGVVDGLRQAPPRVIERVPASRRSVITPR
jgi:hypothetical protein